MVPTTIQKRRHQRRGCHASVRSRSRSRLLLVAVVVVAVVNFYSLEDDYAYNINHSLSLPLSLPLSLSLSLPMPMINRTSKTSMDATSSPPPSSPPPPSPPLIKLRYVGVAGLGHRLMRMSNAYHLSKALGLSELDVFWRGYCPRSASSRSQPNVFHYLFGDEPLKVNANTNANANAKVAAHGRDGNEDDSPSLLLLSSNVHNAYFEWMQMPATHQVSNLGEKKNTATPPPTTTTTKSTEPSVPKLIKLINNVPGYTHMYSKQQIMDRMQNKSLLLQQSSSASAAAAAASPPLTLPFFGKLDTDYDFYSQLISRFQFRKQVETLVAPYYNPHNNNYTMIGIHIRAGNGEDGDFAKYRQLGQGNISGWLSNFTNTLRQQVLNTNNNNLSFRDRPPVLFLATDTKWIIDYFRNVFERETKTIQTSNTNNNNNNNIIPILVTPQVYPEKGRGVSYNGHHHANADMCLESWKHQMMDMFILSEYTQILIAGQYSSFTQSLPLSRILRHPNDKDKDDMKNNNNQDNGAGARMPSSASLLSSNERMFCDVSQHATAFQCFQDVDHWITKQEEHAIRFESSSSSTKEERFAGSQVMFPVEFTENTMNDLLF